MKRFLIVVLSFFIAPIFMMKGAVAQERPKSSIQMGLSDEVIEISSSFDGTDIIVFGSIENPDPMLVSEQQMLGQGRYDVVVVLSGPMQEVTVRRKEKILGIWANGASVKFGDVPASYAYATTRPLFEIAEAVDVKLLQIGLENLSVVPREVEEVEGTAETAEDLQRVFRESLARLKIDKDLFEENIGGVQFLSPTLFKVELPIPANVPIGEHTARVFLFADGKFLDAQFEKISVRKIGFEQFTYNLAHSNGLLYGIIAVLVAMFTGWAASVIFRKD
ncbi:TIGR02186 family protein [Ahrensia sp. R2A130]|uniref:TIGR02186 family protein n=1 Tax=Ahrensia sp. R2A130 TaxID=744979 RepID=UPI0001E0CA22|nr:TIGR02186 family protein [Ahrensia sp. R2A130]EFL87860.1 (Alph_Pro_TM) superfamily protein [Ahrensia sp. R2A130]